MSALWTEVYDRFDPYQPVPMDRAEWHAERTYDQIGKLAHRLSLPRARKFLYLGSVGTGKSTELRRLATMRAADDFVLLIDLQDHFSRVIGNSAALQHVSPWEICFLTGLALYQAASERLALPWPQDVLLTLERAWRAAAGAAQVDAPSAEMDMGKLAKAALAGAGVALGGVAGGAAVAAAVKIAETAVESLRWNLPMGKARRSLSDDTEASKDLLASVNRIIGEIQQRHRSVLLIVDGLDRIQQREHIARLFIESEMLSRLRCRVVLCGPFALRHDQDLNAVRGFDACFHVNEPVMRKEDPQKRGNGVAFFWDMFRRRTRDLSDAPLLPEELLLHLAYYSGGRARDFVRLVRSLAEHRVLEPDTPIERSVETTIDEARRTLEVGLHRGHIDLLRAVAADPEHRLPQDELVWDLLRNGLLLPYPNESEWFFPHPLLTLHMVPPPWTG